MRVYVLIVSVCALSLLLKSALQQVGFVVEAVSLCALSELHNLMLVAFGTVRRARSSDCSELMPVAEQDSSGEACMILPPTDDVMSEASDDQGEQETGPEAMNCGGSALLESRLQVRANSPER